MLGFNCQWGRGIAKICLCVFCGFLLCLTSLFEQGIVAVLCVLVASVWSVSRQLCNYIIITCTCVVLWHVAILYNMCDCEDCCSVWVHHDNGWMILPPQNIMCYVLKAVPLHVIVLEVFFVAFRPFVIGMLPLGSVWEWYEWASSILWWHFIGTRSATPSISFSDAMHILMSLSSGQIIRRHGDMSIVGIFSLFTHTHACTHTHTHTHTHTQAHRPTCTLIPMYIRHSKHFQWNWGAAVIHDHMYMNMCVWFMHPFPSCFLY